MILSVVIPTRNRAPLLQRVLDSLLVQSYPADLYEVIIVDNGSKDQTASVCGLFSKQFPNARYYFDDRPGLHVGRHVGMREGQGDVLVYADDDIRAFPSWLAGIAESFEDSQVALVGGKILPEFEIEPPNWVETLWEKTPSGKILTYFSLLDFGEEIREISPFYVFGCNYSIRKSILLDLKGFHPDGMPEELILLRGDGETAVAKAILDHGYKTIYNPRSSVYHYITKDRMTLEYLYRRAYAGGISSSFSEIRKQGSLGQFGFIGTIEHLIRKLHVSLSCFLSDHYKVKYAIEMGYLDGYKFHTESARRDHRLLEWILQENYLGDPK